MEDNRPRGHGEWVAEATVGPHNVRVWGLGNEMWGDWQMGHLSPGAMPSKLSRWRAMRAARPFPELVGVGVREDDGSGG